MTDKRPLRSGTGDPELDMRSRLYLVETSLGLIRAEYSNALALGVVDPLIFVLDCEDEYGGAFARHVKGDDAVNAQIEARRGGSVPDATVTLVQAFSYGKMKGPGLAMFPALAETFSQPPSADTISVVVVSKGGATGVGVPAIEQIS